MPQLIHRMKPFPMQVFNIWLETNAMMSFSLELETSIQSSAPKWGFIT